ncbi:MAG TPA: outer membrane protein transport protein [Gallionella sp.]|nr:outer membrane protein transport protein [Gallionella sp.]
MRIKKLVVSLLAAGIAVSPLAHATNGDTMMAVGSQNTALGGTGVAHFVGAESTFANPAMLGKSRGAEVAGGLTIFDPTVTNTGFSGATAVQSTAKTSFIPDVSYSDRISNNLSYGIAMAGIAGMGVDYVSAPVNLYVAAKTTMSILKIVPTIAYNADNYGIGFSPVLQYGSLAISYVNAGGAYNPTHAASTDTALGFTLGGYYDVSPAATVGVSYNSPIKATYGTQLSGAGDGFGQGTTSPGTSRFGDQLEQPAEIKIGFSMAATDSVTLTADYRQIQWGSAAGYKAFGWKDQDVLSIGAKFSGNGYWAGIGYNSANNPIVPYNNGAPLTPAGQNGGIVNFFNNMMFPATIKDAFTFGGGYTMNKNLDLEGSVMIAPRVTTRVDVSDAMRMAPGSFFNTTTHKQTSVSVSLRYKF